MSQFWKQVAHIIRSPANNPSQGLVNTTGLTFAAAAAAAARVTALEHIELLPFTVPA
jgi:hypothetical protein